MFHQVKEYLKYYFRADTIHNVHSPFVFEFINEVLDTSKEYYIFNHLEYERRILESTSGTIVTQDFGAGSQKLSSSQKSISDISKNVVSNAHKCRILFNLINKFQPHYTVELGTSLGIATMYIANACKRNQVFTIEADPAIYKLAITLFERNRLLNVNAINNTFDNSLDTVLNDIDTMDIGYIDGHHTYEATMNNYAKLKSKCTAQSIIVFDDIYWSEGMTKAWQEVKADPDVVYTIDTFDFGFAFFDKSIGEKRDFTLIEFKKKPYRIGLWG
jgi:predicted O-methyltransferase YrrM